MLLATVNEPITLSMLASDARADLFGQVRVYNSVGTLVATLSLTHMAEGIYTAQYTPTVEGFFNLGFQLYFDAGHTADAGYERQGEILDVNSFRTNILKNLGLDHENTVVDQQTYDVDGNLQTARIRAYDSAINATNAAAVSPSSYTTGLKFTWQVNAEYSLGLLSKYFIVRV